MIKGITAKGILIATLPLLLVPLLTYLLTPVVIPITANVAAGRRRRRRRRDLTSHNLTTAPSEQDFLWNLAREQQQQTAMNNLVEAKARAEKSFA